MTYTVEDIRSEITPLSDNGFVAFFQNLWRSWLGVWYAFCDKHPKGSRLIKEFIVMFLFSNLVTIWQALVMIFLPYAFESIWASPFVWPAIALPWADGAGNPLNYAIFNEPVKLINGELTALASTPEMVESLIAQGYTVQMSGLGNFIAFEIAVFTAQCINFPLQRNITFKSKGNPVVQGIWYFIGWVGISVGVNAVWGICNPLMLYWQWDPTIIALIKTFITGGVSMLVFFPIFKVIFPDIEAQSKQERAKLDKMVAGGASQDKIDEQTAKTEKLEAQAALTKAEKERDATIKVSSNKAIAYFSILKKAENAQTEEEKQALLASAEKAFQDAVDAAEARKAADSAYQALVA